MTFYSGQSSKHRFLIHIIHYKYLFYFIFTHKSENFSQFYFSANLRSLFHFIPIYLLLSQDIVTNPYDIFFFEKRKWQDCNPYDKTRVTRQDHSMMRLFFLIHVFWLLTHVNFLFNSSKSRANAIFRKMMLLKNPTKSNHYKVKIRKCLIYSQEPYMGKFLVITKSYKICSIGLFWVVVGSRIFFFFPFILSWVTVGKYYNLLWKYCEIFIYL